MLLTVGLPLALAFIMFSLGLGLTYSDFTRVAAMPKAFAIGLICQAILLPVIGFVIAVAFDLSPALSVGVMILAASPGGVTSNVLSKLAKGNVALSVSLTALISLLSVITVPLIVAFSATYFMGEATPAIDVTKTAISMFFITALPVGLGMVFRALLQSLSLRIEPTLSLIAVIVFAIIVLAALVLNWSLFVTNIAVLAPAVVALNVILLAVGFGLAKTLGLKGTDATTIAIETGVQNSTLAIAVAGIILSGDAALGSFALPAAIYGITMYLVTVPFVLWRRTR